MKFLRNFLLLLIVFLFIGYVAGNYYLTKLGEEYKPQIKADLEKHGLDFRRFNYGNISVGPPKSIVIHDVLLVFNLDRRVLGQSGLDVQIEAQQLIFTVENFSERTVTVALKDMYLTLNNGVLQEHVLGELTHANVKYLRPISITEPEEELDSLLTQFEHLIFQNKAHNIELQATVNVSISGKPFELTIETQKDGEEVFLGFKPEDVMAASSQIGLKVAPQEAEIIARNPEAVPDMLRITKEARDKSRALAKSNPGFPEDAYRHVYWSYHLTRAVGSQLAREITDAHETVEGNTPAQRSMDYHNNEVARSLAKTVLSDDQLADYVLNSDTVIRFPEE